MYYAPISYMRKFLSVFTALLIASLALASSVKAVSTLEERSEFSFPSCSEKLLSGQGDKVHYDKGNLHQIIGADGKQSGSDDVYTLEQGYLQCFCPDAGFDGTQTNWLRTETNPGSPWNFFPINGLQWDLGDYTYAAYNISFSCGQEPTPTPVPTPTPYDACTNIDGIQASVPQDWFQISPDSTFCRKFEYGGPESAHVDNPGSPAVEGISVHPQVLGASTMATAGSFAENLYLVIMICGTSISFLGIKNLRKV